MLTATPDHPLRLGTRGSPLALAQAHETRARLSEAHQWPENAIEIVQVQATGDRIQDRPLAEIGGKALWTKELDAALVEGRIDFAVHSAKDVETFRPPEIAIAAILPREDVRDVLIGADSLARLPQGAVVGTSAPRRAAQLLYARPDCRVVPIRGNVATRLAKVEAGEVAATFLAAAGLVRLGMETIGHRFDPATWLPAPGQAAIAIECRAGDEAVLSCLNAIDHAPSHRAVLAERALLAALGGTCHSPIAVYTKTQGAVLAMQAAIFSPDGAERVAGEAQFEAIDMVAPAQLAEDMLARASATVRAAFSGPERIEP